MRIKGVDITDYDYDLHVQGDCTIDCKICLAEQRELFKSKNKKKKDEGEKSTRS